MMISDGKEQIHITFIFPSFAHYTRSIKAHPPKDCAGAAIESGVQRRKKDRTISC